MILLPMPWRVRSGRTDMAAKCGSESSRCFRGRIFVSCAMIRLPAALPVTSPLMQKQICLKAIRLPNRYRQTSLLVGPAGSGSNRWGGGIALFLSWTVTFPEAPRIEAHLDHVRRRVPAGFVAGVSALCLLDLLLRSAWSTNRCRCSTLGQFAVWSTN